MMSKCGRTRTTSQFLFLFIVIFLFFQFLLVIADGAQEPGLQDKLAKRVADTITMLKKSHKSSWDKIKTIIHDLQSQYFPPNLDFRSADESNTRGNGKGDAAKRMKEAAEKTLGASRITADKSAKSAVNAVGEAMRKTANVVKEKGSAHDHDHEENHDEL